MVELVKYFFDDVGRLIALCFVTYLLFCGIEALIKAWRCRCDDEDE